MIGSQNSTGSQQTANINVLHKEDQRKQIQSGELQQGFTAGNFQFEKQQQSMEQILQKPRSQEYLAAVEMIDFLTSDDEAVIKRLKENMDEEFVEEIQEMSNEEIFEMITKAFHEEFAELETTVDELQAVLTRCYIDGCDCHAIDRYGHILDHYRSDMTLPEDLERGRNVYRAHVDRCMCVEVYKSCCRVISDSGDVEVIKK